MYKVHMKHKTILISNTNFAQSLHDQYGYDLITFPYLPTFESQKTEHAILRGSKATKPEGGKLPRGEGGVPPPRVGSFCIFGLQIVQSGAYLERKFRLKIYCM